MSGVFDSLTPERIIEAVEEETGQSFTGLTTPLPSYINRVYELENYAGERLIAKFYRPGRWNRAALEDERHRFLLDCAAAEIPVVAPVILGNGTSIGRWEKIHFTLFSQAIRP